MLEKNWIRAITLKQDVPIYVVKQSAAQQHSSTGYRDQTLSYMELPLQKKKYESTQHIIQQSKVIIENFIHVFYVLDNLHSIIT